MRQTKHSVYGSLVSIQGEPVEGVSTIQEADAISLLMMNWQECVKKNNIDFFSYVVSFYVKDRPFTQSQVGYWAVHIEDVANVSLSVNPITIKTGEEV